MQTPSVDFVATDKAQLLFLDVQGAFEDGLPWPTYKSACPGGKDLCTEPYTRMTHRKWRRTDEKNWKNAGRHSVIHL